MGTPPFVTELRRLVGNAPLPLVGVTAVIVDQGERVLLGHRSDNGALAPPSGIVEPGEEPADTAVREAMEEAGVRISVTRLAWVHQLPRIVYDNGDQVDYLDLTFRCAWVSGTPHPTDGELLDVAWFDSTRFGALRTDHRRRVEHALASQGPTHFEQAPAPDPHSWNTAT